MSIGGCKRESPPAHGDGPAATDPPSSATETDKPVAPQLGVSKTEIDLPDDVVRLKNVSLALIDAGLNPDAAAACDKLMRLLPDEPLAVANRGLVALRSAEGDSQRMAARALLDRAAAMAPNNAGIAALLGHVEAARSHSEQAADFLRRAIALDPDDVRAPYALYDVLETIRTPEAKEEQMRIFDGLAAVRPDNLLIRVQLLRWRLEDRDQADAARQLSVVRAMELRASPDSQAQLMQAEEMLAKAAELLDEGNIDQARPLVIGATNLLKPCDNYQDAVAELQGPDKYGEPLRAFLNTDAADIEVRPDGEPLRFAVSSALTGSAGQVIAASFVYADASSPPLIGQWTGGGIGLLRRQSDGSYGEESSASFDGGETGAGSAMGGLLPIDWNNDVQMDLATIRADGVVMVALRGSDGQWGPVQPVAELDLPASGNVHFLPYDVDMDGDLDVLIGASGGALQVLHNARGDDAKAGTTVKPFNDGTDAVRAIATGDLNDDGVADVLTVDGDGLLVVWVNRRRGRFDPIAIEGGPTPVAAIEIADINNDGRDDIVAMGANGVVGLGQQDLAGQFAWTQMSPFDPTDAGSASLQVCDFNNDGYKDAIAIHAGRTALLRNANAPAFAIDPVEVPCKARSVARPADADVDGDLDVLLVCEDGKVALLDNNSGGDRPWHRVQLMSAAKGSSRVNAFGVGSTLEVTAGGFYQKYTTGDAVAHVGMGAAEMADHIRVIWPNGVSQEIILPNTNQTIVEEQRLKGSCPFLFANDGTTFAFVTDLLWRSPLGMMVNAQDVAPVVATEDYVKVGADQLIARDGQYDLRFTSSLWETIFVDELKLICVDHPAGVEVFVDERFLAPEPPPHRIYAVESIRPPVSAVDHRGRDVLDIVANRDGNRLAGFALGRYQGVAEDHFVEVKVPPGDEGRPLYLLASGWIFPTDTSINVALSQAGATPPRPVSIEAPDGAGGWRTVIGNAGFPAGKLKTIVIDLSEVVHAEDRRIRISTNLEVYWDRIAFATGRPDVEAQMRTLALSPAVADLGFLGFPRLVRERRSDPSIPMYEQINRVSQWADLEGYHTRYGDVIPLLADTDDRYVIMNAGDQMRLLFDAPAKPPAGWVRDFVFFSDGWVKDGDYNTVASATVGPLPHHNMSGYPYPASETPSTLQPDHPDWSQFHTRYVTPTAFRERWRPGN